MEQASFILGMISAFCECVAAGCKPMALSPPLTDAAYALVSEDAVALVEGHGLEAYHERNFDLPEAERRHWLVIYAKEEVLMAYLCLRSAGKNPARALEPFAGLLGYAKERVHTGFDAYQQFFPKDAAPGP